jgi:hypothetical protein
MSKKLSKRELVKRNRLDILKRLYKTFYQAVIGVFLSASPAVIDFIGGDELELSRVNPLLIPLLIGLVSTVDNSLRSATRKKL